MEGEEAAGRRAAAGLDARTQAPTPAGAEVEARSGRRHLVRRLLSATAVVVLLAGTTAFGYAHWYHTLPHYAPPATHQPVPAVRDEVRLIVLGDWGSGQRPQAWVAAAASERARRLGGVHGIVSTGDNFYSKGVRGTDDPLWHTVFEEVYDTEWLGAVPWYACLGNHDYNGGRTAGGWGNTRAQIEYGARSNGHWNMPAEYFRKDFGPEGADPILTLLIVDTNPWFARHDAQAAWLDAQLAELDDKPWHRVVVGHHPIYSVATHGRVAGDLAAKYVEPLLRKHGVALYLSGHHHTLQVIERDGVSYATVGGSGRRLYELDPDRTAATFVKRAFGFGVLRATRDAVSLEFINRDGGLEHRWTRRCPKCGGTGAIDIALSHGHSRAVR
jgi:hypothetical protein